MKRFTFFFAFAVALYLTGGIAYAQHGHGASGAVGGLAAHGESASHGNAGDSGTGNSTGAAPKSASTQLMNNQHLNDALTDALTKNKLLPTEGLVAFCQGFSSLGRCISTIHVAHNRRLDLLCLKQVMMPPPPTGTTKACSATQTNLKLGQAIQALDPNADPKVEATKATKQANTDIDNASHSET